MFGECKSLFTEIKRDLVIIFSFMIVKWSPKLFLDLGFCQHTFPRHAVSVLEYLKLMFNPPWRDF